MYHCTAVIMSKRKKLYDSSASITTYFKKKSGKQCTGPLDFFKYYESDIDMSGRALLPRPNKLGVAIISAAPRAANSYLNPPFPKPVSATDSTCMHAELVNN